MTKKGLVSKREVNLNRLSLRLNVVVLEQSLTATRSSPFTNMNSKWILSRTSWWKTGKPKFIGIK
jgi:hypothetical protein